MQRICEYCKQPTLNELNIDDKKTYLCLSCGKISNKFIESHSDIVSIDTKKGVKHITVGALIYDQNGRILMVKRRVWPYVYDFPAGHLDYNENPPQAIKREVLEETGLMIDKMELLFNGEIENDHCRYGASIHEWYFFRCQVKSPVSFKNSELDSIHWLPLEKIRKFELLPAARYVVDHVIEKKDSLPEITHPIYHKHALLDGEEKQNELIYHISSALLKIEHSDNILSVATEEILTATNIDSISILLKTEKNEIKCQITKGKQLFNKHSQEIAEKCARLGKNVMGRSKNKSLLALPMISNGETIGVIVAEMCLPGFFIERETQFLTIVTNEIAVGITNSRLIESIKKENDLLTSVLENSGEGILVIDNYGKILAVNKFLEESLGINEKDLVGTNSASLAGKLGIGDYQKKVMLAMKSKMEGSRLYDEVEAKLPSGEKIWFGLITSFIRDSLGKITGSVIILRNITQEKELLQAKNDLVTTATHELRTPLTAIKGYLSMLKEGDAGKVTPHQLKYLERAYSSTERLVGLVEDLLSTLKIEENKINLDIVDFDIGEVIADSISSLKSKAKSKKLKIHYKYSPTYVHADKIKSKHIIENLLDNAIKYTRNNGIISIETKSQAQNILISVQDNGVGIPQKYKTLVFDKFVRVKNTLSVNAGGTGLGLYIAKSLIEKQGGKIWLDSEHQKGTTFYFTVPASELCS